MPHGICEQYFMRTILNDNRYLSSSFINIRNIAIVYHLFYRTCNALPLCFNSIGNNNNDSAHKNKAATQQTAKQQPAAKVVKKTGQTNNKKQSVNTKAVTPKKSTAQQQPSKSKNVTSDHKSTDSKYDKNHKS